MRKKIKKKPVVSILSRLQLFKNLDVGTTIVHFYYRIPDEKRETGWVNINKDSHLINDEQVMNSFLSLVHPINIPVSPERLYFRDCGEEVHFTLIFDRIPDHWKSFSFQEWLKDSIGMEVRGIKKNETGVYHLRLG